MKKTTGGFDLDAESKKGTKTGINILECKQLCLRLKSCRSIGYFEVEKECHTYGIAPVPLNLPNQPCCLYVKSCGKNLSKFMETRRFYILLRFFI